MSQRSKAIETLSEYFETKGEILSPQQYRKEKDTPIRLEAVKRTFGTWSRMEKIVRAFDARNKNRPEPTTDAREVIAEQNRLAAEHEALIRAVGEDVEQKTAREEAARKQIEADALRAATAEGARDNKVRKGGPESVDAKTIKESLQRAVASEHAMLAKTPEGAALGKELLGGLEDQDAKNEAIARENARTERSALLTATATGAAKAKMEEDDSDGQLTREAQARIRNELRLYVEPAKEEAVETVAEEARQKLRPEAASAVEELTKTDDLSIGAAERGDLRYAETDAEKIVTEGDMSKAPPADAVPDENLVRAMEDDQLKEAGLERAEEPEAKQKPAEVKSPVTDAKREISPTAKENKETVNEEENKLNPEAPPADRNPDTKVQVPAEDVKVEEPPKPKNAPTKPRTEAGPKK